MRIGIDVTMLQIHGGRHGTGSYVRGLIRGLAARDDPHDVTLLAYADPPLDLPPLPGRFRRAVIPAPSIGRARAVWSHQVALPALGRRLGLDLLHVPGVPFNASMPGIPLGWPGSLVVTVHDLIPLLFPDVVLRGRRHHLFYRLMLRVAARADQVICDSEATRRDVAAHLRVDTGRLHVVPLAADSVFGAGPDAPDDPRAAALEARPFVLHVGGAARIKSIDWLLAAMTKLWDTAAVCADVVSVTAVPFDPVALCPAAAAHRARIHVLEAASTPFLRWLYQHARCAAVTSRSEGFGLPVLEAMASGCPVVASRAASLPEVGGAAALYVEPMDVRELSRVLQTLITDPERRAVARAAGLARAREFTWDRTAAATSAVYEKARRPA